MVILIWSSIASDPSVSGPAVDVAVMWVRWVREEVHGGLGDTVSGGTGGAMIWADEVAFPGKEVAEVGAFGILGALGAESK